MLIVFTTLYSNYTNIRYKFVKNCIYTKCYRGLKWNHFYSETVLVAVVFARQTLVSLVVVQGAAGQDASLALGAVVAGLDGLGRTNLRWKQRDSVTSVYKNS